MPGIDASGSVLIATTPGTYFVAQYILYRIRDVLRQINRTVADDLTLAQTRYSPGFMPALIFEYPSNRKRSIYRIVQARDWLEIHPVSPIDENLVQERHERHQLPHIDSTTSCKTWYTEWRRKLL